MDKYEIRCLDCGKEFSGYALSCNCDSFLRAEYSEELRIRDLPGMWKFIDWLPCEKILDTRSGPVTYRSEELGRELGLKNLYITFSGYWSEKEAYCMTCSFKDLEASPTIARARENEVSSLLVASAGNTARAFAHAANKTGFELYLVVPEPYLYRVWTPEEPSKNIHLIAVRGDYLDAINLGKTLAEREGITAEGGAKNVARRDGMGTVMLDGADSIGRLPDHYFQAVGSGTGAISCWEMAKRLKERGVKAWPKLNLSQNRPFVPIYNAWKDGRREISAQDMPNAKKSIEKTYSTALSNRNPPYSIKGGLYDAMRDTGGEMYAVTNEEAEKAGKLFESLEGIDPLPAANVAVASLIQAVEKGKVGRDDTILLNVTGGGTKLLKEDHNPFQIKPERTVEVK